MDTAEECGYQAGPEHFGYLVKAVVADTDEKAQEIGRNFLWAEPHRQRGPREFNDPPGYQSREALKLQAQRPTGAFARQMSYEELQEAYNVVVGSPDTIIKKLRYVRDKLNPGQLIIWGNDGPMDHKDSMRSIELLGKEVIPALKES